MESPVLRAAQAAEHVQLSVNTLRARNDPKSDKYDPDFPLPLALGADGPGRKPAVGWLRSELDDYLARKAQKRGLAGQGRKAREAAAK